MSNCSRLAWVVGALLAALVPSPAASEGVPRKVEDFSVEVPPGWTLVRGATSDGTLGHLLEPPSLADGEESFAIYLRPFVPPSLEPLAKALQQETVDSGRPVYPVERLRRFDARGRPGIRAELTGTDRYSGAPSRVIFWVVPRDGSSVVIFRAVLPDARFALFAALLEGTARSIAFDYAYAGPGYEDFGRTQVQVSEGVLESDAGGSGAEGGDALYNLDGEAGAPPSRHFAEPGGSYCRKNEREGGVTEGLQFDGKGQWARHEGAPPEKFTNTGLPPDRSGFYRAAGHLLLLEAHTGRVTRCIRRSDALMSCDGEEFEEGGCG